MSLILFRMSWLIAFYFHLSFLNAQRFSQTPSALALGGSAYAYDGIHAIGTNPAAIASLKGWNLQSHYRNKFIAKEWNDYAIHFAHVLPKYGAFALHWNASGFALFHQNKWGFNYARNFGPYLRMGMNLNYHAIFQSQPYPTLHAFSSDFGIQVIFLKNFIWGFAVYNPIRMKLSNLWPEKIPMLIGTGFQYKHPKGLRLIAELEKNIDAKWMVRFGMEYEFYKNFYASIGFHTSPLAPSLGFGFQKKGVHLYWASAYNHPAGMEMAFSLAYLWKQ